MTTLAKEGMTMVIVSHELGFAQKVANRLAFMDDGEIIEIGTPDQILTSPKHPRTKDFVSKIIHVEQK
jgi:polar amino acid transport system ATP-binding protein